MTEDEKSHTSGTVPVRALKGHFSPAHARFRLRGTLGDVGGDGAPEPVAVGNDGRVSVVDPSDGTVVSLT